MKIKKSIWISYDLGIKGDFASLYAWLDNHDAIECGNSVAYIKYEIDEADFNDDKLISLLKADIEGAVNLSKSDRFYVVWRDKKMSIKGNFVFGNRKQAPWEGYGDVKGKIVEDLEK